MATLTPDNIQNFSRKQLSKMIEYGIIELMPNSKDPNKITKEDFPEYQKHSSLAGTPIHLRAACRKYDISKGTISNYIESGFITVLGKEKNKLLLDEQDVAYCSDMLNEYGGRGRKALRDDGTPNYP